MGLINPNKPLTVLSFGGGQDSTAIFYKLLFDHSWQKKYRNDNLLVLMANTMNEHNETYMHIVKIGIDCLQHSNPQRKIIFRLINAKDGYTPKSWQKGLVSFYSSGNRIGSKAYNKTCTDNLKIKPIYNFLEEFIHTEYSTQKYGRKRAIYEYAQRFGKVDVLIGIAREEEKRASTNEESPHVWMKKCVNKIYPLIENGMNRKDCQDYIISVGREVPVPSNCILCHFMDEKELLLLYRTQKHWFNIWVKLESNKILANSHVENNLGVWGKKLLPQVLEKAKSKWGHMTTDELKEHRMSHGHCVMSKY